jgi:hypothetical protein
VKKSDSNSGRFVKAVLVVAFLIAMSSIASAQLDIGDNLHMKLNGSTGYSYSGSFGSDSNSYHANGLLFDFSGNGYYFHPNFLSFDFHPYYQRTQANSQTQSIGQGSGVGASVSLFGASHFPGSISYGKDFGSQSNFQVAGVPTFSNNSSGQTFGVSWSALLPKWPQVTASFSKGSTQSSFADLGTSTNSTTTLNLTASYQIKGWNLQSGTNHFTGAFDTPAYLTATAYSGDSSSTSYYATAGHALPLHGMVSVGWGHSNTDSSAGYSYGTTSYTASNSFMPIRNFTIFQNVNYVTNLSGMLLQNLSNGISVSSSKFDYNSYGMTYGNGASYYLGHGVSVGGYFNHRYQNLDDRSYGDSQYGGNVNFTHSARLFGLLSFGIGMSDTASATGNHGGGISANVGMNKRLGHWETAADFNYAQNVLTLGTFSTTSNYSYGGNIRRRITKELSFGGAYRSSRSGIVNQDGDGNVAHSVNGQMQWRKYSFSGGYSESNGSAVLSSNGTLIPTSIGSVLIPELLLFNARSYNASASATFFRRVSLSGAYTKFNSDTQSSLSSAINTGSNYSGLMQYRLRKFQFTGGFNHTQQESSTITGGPRVLNSFYLSISRWFNVF